MYSLKHKGKILGTFESYILLLGYVSKSKLGIYQVSKDNEKYSIIVNESDKISTSIYEKKTCKEIFRTYFRWFVMATYIKKLKKIGIKNEHIYKRKIKPPFIKVAPIIIKTQKL